jgi:hypothetical protein
MNIGVTHILLIGNLVFLFFKGFVPIPWWLVITLIIIQIILGSIAEGIGKYLGKKYKG